MATLESLLTIGGLTVTIKSLLLFVLSLLFVFASFDAFAGQPISHSFGYFRTIEVVDCGDFSVMDDAEIMADVKDYCDADGNITRSHVHMLAMDDFYRSDNPAGKHVTGTTRINDRASMAGDGTPIWTPAGINVAVRIRGLGLMFLDVGMLDIEEDCDWIVDFSADRFHDWGPADFDALCAQFE